MTPVAARAAASDWIGDARGSARLITAVEATGSGSRLDAALELRLAPGWYTYWRTPGDAGFPTTIDWSGSENLAGAELSWPAPARKAIAGLHTNVYHDRVILPISLVLARPGEPVRLRAEVDYASCNQVCIPYHASIDLALPSGLATPGPDAPLVAKAMTQLPGSLAGAGLRLVSATVSGLDKASTLAVTVASDTAPLRAPDLFIEGAPNETPPEPSVRLEAGGLTATLNVPLSPEAATKVIGKPLIFTFADGSRIAEFTAEPTRGASPEGVLWELPAMLGIALLGGLILNLMPCVLPVISLKLLSLAGYVGSERRHVRGGLMATAAGVVTSFLVIAAALTGLKLAGAAIGWGIQFQQPWFLAAMALAMTLFAASLWGLLPIGLPAFAASAANVRARHPLLDAFFAGAFATLMATSCSAPFVGTAVGFALSRGSAEIMLIFAALGLGMAAPLLAAAAFPEFVQLLPTPGPWMLWLQRALGIALAATAMWLLWVLAQVAGTTAALIAAASLIGLMGALASRHAAVNIPRRRAGTAVVLSLGAIAVLIPALAIPSVVPTTQGSPQGLKWQAFDPDAIRQHVADGKIVFVDVTAAWCLTCKVNEAAVLDRTPVADRLRSPDVVAMRADWTRPEPRITAYLQSFGRYGVPLNVVYGPTRPNGDLLPELLTPSAVLGAMSRSSGSGTDHVAGR
ncbi:MAG: protein-disulfide reductase [Rhodospirillales bacterium 69-11]|nr:MAG: protein-disulfide reductase [Rhodospirillales bacterium 69-11]